MSEEKMVAVMLLREDVHSCLVAPAISPLADRLKAACKKALRPKPPSTEMMFRLTENGVEEWRGVGDFIKHVLANGWEPDE